MCSECLKAQAGEDTSAKARLARMLQANEEKDRIVTRLRVFSVFLPGLAQAYSGRVGKAFVYMLFFVSPAVALMLNPYFSTGLEGGGHIWLWLIAAPLMALVYIVSCIFDSLISRASDCLLCSIISSDSCLMLPSSKSLIPLFIFIVPLLKACID